MKETYNLPASTKFILDTYVFIWLMKGDKKIPESLIATLKDQKNSIFLSIASIWEITIKKMSGRLKIPANLEIVMESGGIKLLPIELSHVLGLEDLPAVHKDPFDRILISQAKIEGYTLITSDNKISKNEVPLIKI